MLVLSSGRVVLEDILYGTSAVVPHGGGAGDFRLSPLVNFEHGVPFFNQEVRTFKLEDQFVVQYVGNERPVGLCDRFYRPS